MVNPIVFKSFLELFQTWSIQTNVNPSWSKGGGSLPPEGFYAGTFDRDKILERKI